MSSVISCYVLKLVIVLPHLAKVPLGLLLKIQIGLSSSLCLKEIIGYLHAVIVVRSEIIFLLVHTSKAVRAIDRFSLMNDAWWTISALELRLCQNLCTIHDI